MLCLWQEVALPLPWSEEAGHLPEERSDTVGGGCDEGEGKGGGAPRK